MKIDALLKKEIESEFEELSKIEVGSEQYKVAVDGLAKLMDRAIEIDKSENEKMNQINEFELKQDELELKNKEFKDDKRDKLIRNIIAGAGIAIPSMITVWGTIKSIKFEQEGTITTIIGRGFINKLLPKK